MNPVTEPLEERPLRADARRNRAKVLDGARAAFADEGLDVDMASVAARAGVGVGTMYRHFPTKDRLIDALAADHFERLADITEAGLTEDGDPGQAFEAVIRRCAEHTAADHGMCEVVRGRPSAVQAAVIAQQRLAEATAQLVDRARTAGALRADAKPDDVRTMMCGFASVAAAQRSGAPVDRERYLDLALDSLRAR